MTNASTGARGGRTDATPDGARLAVRARLVSYAMVALLVAIGWGYLVAVTAGGHDPAALGPGMSLIAPALERIAGVLPSGLPGAHETTAGAPWGAGDLSLVFAMWAAMVLAMMLPTLAPAIRAQSLRGGSVAALAAGYLGVWFAVALVATAGQAALTAAGALSPHMEPAGAALSASVLIAAGIYQFTPLKHACLARCRNPHAAAFRAGSPGAAFRLGAEEGLACLGCCWAMMAVMFAAGLMNLVAMAFLGAAMALEKLVRGHMFTYSLGVAMLLLGFGLASGLFFR